MPKVLVIYCSPSSEDRLRLDKEDRALAEAAAHAKFDESQIVKKHAATIQDLTYALSTGSYDVVQFSGHADAEGVAFDSDTDESEKLPYDDLLTLLARTQKSARVLLLMCCFSHDAAAAFHSVFPHVISVLGAGDDDAVVRYIREFYRLYLKMNDVGLSHAAAYLPLRGRVEVVHSARETTGNAHICIRVIIQGYQTSEINVDLREAELDIERLVGGRGEFLQILSRKLRIHSDIFALPRERALIPIGPYIGLFSWASANNVICHRVYRVRDDVDASWIEAWVFFCVMFNDAQAHEYRSPKISPSDPKSEHLLSWAFRDFSNLLCRVEGLAAIGAQLLGNSFSMSKAAAAASLESAQTCLDVGDAQGVVRNLESALSAMHDIVNGLCDKLTVE